MYNVKRYSVSKARERFADVLDEADRNGSVLIERGDVQYVITAKGVAKRPTRRRSVIVQQLLPAKLSSRDYVAL